MKKNLFFIMIGLGINISCQEVCPDPSSVLTNIRVLTVTTGSSSFTVDRPTANTDITFNNQPKSYDGRSLFVVSNSNPGVQSLFIKNANFGSNKTDFQIAVEAQSRPTETTAIDATLCVSKPLTFTFVAFPVGNPNCPRAEGSFPLNVTLRGPQGIVKPFFVTQRSDLFTFKLLPPGVYSATICLGSANRFGLTISFVPFSETCTSPSDLLDNNLVKKYNQ